MEKDEHPDSPIVSRKTRQSLEVRRVTQYKTCTPDTFLHKDIYL